MGTFLGMDASTIEERYGAPTVRTPEEPQPGRLVLGRRVLVGVVDPELDLMQWSSGYVAASDVFEEAGTAYVHVVTEAQWWAWTLLEHQDKPVRCPRAKCWPTYLVRLSPE